jgi:hypothetical protein
VVGHLVGSEGNSTGIVDVDSEERVVRLTVFVGDSTGGGKSLGWLRVATMIGAAYSVF